MTEYVRLKTRTNSSKVHRADGGGEPRCRARRGKKCATQGGDAREWVEVDESKYPKSWWDRCKRCFDEVATDGGAGARDENGGGE